jgi:hypothetical protein
MSSGSCQVNYAPGPTNGEKLNDYCTDTNTSVPNWGGGTCDAKNWTCAGNPGVLNVIATGLGNGTGVDTFGSTVDNPFATYWSCGGGDGGAGQPNKCVSAATAVQNDACSDSNVTSDTDVLNGYRIGGGSCSATDWKQGGANTAASPGYVFSLQTAGVDRCGGSDPSPLLTYSSCRADDGSVNDACFNTTYVPTGAGLPAGRSGDWCTDNGSQYGGGACGAQDWYCQSSPGKMYVNSTGVIVPAGGGVDFCKGTYLENVSYYFCGSRTSGLSNSVFKSQVQSDGSLGPWATETERLANRTLNGKSVVASAGGRTYAYLIGGYGPNLSAPMNQSWFGAGVFRSEISSADGSLGAWSLLGLMPAGLINPGVALVPAGSSQFIYVIGGSNETGDNQIERRVWRAQIQGDGSLGAWIESTQLPIVLAQAAAFSSQSDSGTVFLYAVGGSGSGWEKRAWLAPVQADGSLGAWAETSGLPRGLYFPAAVVATEGAAKYVYVLGGYLIYNSTSTTVDYPSSTYRSQINADGSLGAWSEATMLPYTMLSQSAAITSSSSGSLFAHVIGGYHNSSGIPVAEVWTASAGSSLGAFGAAPSLPLMLKNHASFVADFGGTQYVYVLGGESSVANSCAQNQMANTSACGSNSTCPLGGTLIAPCSRFCANSSSGVSASVSWQGSGTCLSCTPDCFGGESLQFTGFSSIVCESLAGGNTSIANARFLVNGSSNCTAGFVSASVSINGTAVSGVSVTPDCGAGLWRIGFPSMANGTYEVLAFQSGNQSVNVSCSTTKYVVETSASAPDFDLLLLPVLAIGALLLARRRKD